MSYFTDRHLKTTCYIIAVDTSGARMDCEDTSRMHVWVACPAWSSRRAFYTGGDEFFRAAMSAIEGEDRGLRPDQIDHMLDPDDPVGSDMLDRWAKMLVGRHFYIDFDGPADEAEPAERIEFRSIELAPPIEEVMARLAEASRNHPSAPPDA
jgi:hypothetical protein